MTLSHICLIIGLASLFLELDAGQFVAGILTGFALAIVVAHSLRRSAG